MTVAIPSELEYKVDQAIIQRVQNIIHMNITEILRRMKSMQLSLKTINDCRDTVSLFCRLQNPIDALIIW